MSLGLATLKQLQFQQGLAGIFCHQTHVAGSLSPATISARPAKLMQCFPRCLKRRWAARRRCSWLLVSRRNRAVSLLTIGLMPMVPKTQPLTYGQNSETPSGGLMMTVGVSNARQIRELAINYCKS